MKNLVLGVAMAICLASVNARADISKSKSSRILLIDSPAVSPPGYYPFKLGNFKIVALNDGTALLPFDHLFAGVKPGEVQNALSLHHRSSPTETSGNCYLINTGGKLVLVDAGGGDILRAGGLGHLVENLAAAGYRPEQINAVLITHYHHDHTGGLLHNGSEVFPNADIYINQADYDIIFSSAGEKSVTENAAVINVFKPYKDAGRVKTFNVKTEIFPGITAIPTPGHTPGHTTYFVGIGQQKMLIWGDVVHLAEIQFSDPALWVAMDTDGPKAAAQRKRLFAEAAKNGYLIGGAHISFPGLGYINVSGTGYQWIPLAYSTGNSVVLFK